MESPDTASGPSRERPRPPRPHGSACDTCRRRRVRCDGNQPCERCVKSAVSCTYGSFSGRTSAISYARHLENKIAELQALLLERPTTETSDQEQMVLESQDTARRQVLDMLVGPGDDYVYRIPQSSSNLFYGRFGGLSILRTVGNTASRHRAATASMSSPGRDLVDAFESTVYFSPPIATQARINSLLPSKQQVQEMTIRALTTALICHECLDHVAFARRLDRLYEVDPEDYLQDDKSFLTLVYALVALGRRFAPLSADDEVDETSDRVRYKGFSYFQTSYEMLHMTLSYNLDSIRAVICQVRFLSSMSMISKAYSHICVGIAAALRMGLHTFSPALRSTFSTDELFERRKVFATLNMMAMYLSSSLGMPNILKDADVEQSLGLRDEDLVDEGAGYVSRNPTSPLAETVICQKINNILSKVLESRNQISKSTADAPDEANHQQQHHEEDLGVVAMREAEMQEWHDNLPALPDGAPPDPRALQAQLTLRLWHSLAQIVLYRPFLHHLARDASDPRFNLRGYECASACIRAAMQAVWVMEAFHAQGALHEAHWLYTYMLGYAASILTFFVTSSAHRATLEETLTAAQKSRDMLGYLARFNLSARRCFNSLDAILQDVPVGFQTGL